MNDLSVVERASEWQRLKALVLDSVSSPITRRVYNMALDEFIVWFRHPHVTSQARCAHRCATDQTCSLRIHRWMLAASKTLWPD